MLVSYFGTYVDISCGAYNISGNSIIGLPTLFRSKFATKDPRNGEKPGGRTAPVGR